MFCPVACKSDCLVRLLVELSSLHVDLCPLPNADLFAIFHLPVKLLEAAVPGSILCQATHLHVIALV